MFALVPATKVYGAAGTTEMRKGFKGLIGLVRDERLCDPLSGRLFLFANRTRTRLKLRFWDASGLWVCAKRLEKGRFPWPETVPGSKTVKLRAEELAMLVNGMDLKQTRPRRGDSRPRRAVFPALRRRRFPSAG